MTTGASCSWEHIVRMCRWMKLLYSFIIGRCLRIGLSLVNFSVASKIGHDREMATAAFYIASKGYKHISTFVSIHDQYRHVRFSPVWLYMCV